MQWRELRGSFSASHPVQYGAPVFRKFAVCLEVNIHVIYYNLREAEAAYDAEFGMKVQ